MSLPSLWWRVMWLRLRSTGRWRLSLGKVLRLPPRTAQIWWESEQWRYRCPLWWLQTRAGRDQGGQCIDLRSCHRNRNWLSEGMPGLHTLWRFLRRIPRTWLGLSRKRIWERTSTWLAACPYICRRSKQQVWKEHQQPKRRLNWQIHCRLWIWARTLQGSKWTSTLTRSLTLRLHWWRGAFLPIVPWACPHNASQLLEKACREWNYLDRSR